MEEDIPLFHRHMSLYQLLLLVAMLAVLSAGCGSDDKNPTSPTNPTVSETIGSSGGAIEIVNEVCLDVLPGALDGNVTFLIANAGSSHTAMVQSRDVQSAVYSIGPSGTTFNDPVPLTLYYDPASLNGVDPSALVIYTDKGSGWVPLPTTHNAVQSSVTAEITSLSDFAVTAPASSPADGVYAVLEVVRLINYAYTPPGEDIYVDLIVARFDSVVNVCSPIGPLHPGSVKCNGDTLVWDDFFLSYVNEEDVVLNLGASYRFEVATSAEIPYALDETIAMVDANPTIRSPRDGDPVSGNGFTVVWDGTSSGNVAISLMTNDAEALRVEVPNNGSYTFSKQQLSGLGSGIYLLSLGYQNLRYLSSVTGYDPRSHITSYTLCHKLISLTDSPGVVGSEGGIVLLGDDGRLSIPAGALDETIAFTAAVNSSPPAGPDGYTRLTPVYSVGPAGTVFSSPATVEMEYDPDDLDGAPEESIVILRHDGTDWEVLSSDVDTYEQTVSAEVSGLSDFVAAVPVQGEGVYTALRISRSRTSMYGTHVTVDVLAARFDAVVDETSVVPLQAGGVSFGAWEMIWDGRDQYEYFDFSEMAFLTFDSDYTFVVTASDDVPAIDQTISLPGSDIAITGLGDDPELSLDGFTLTWDGATPGSTVRIVIIADGVFRRCGCGGTEHWLGDFQRRGTGRSRGGFRADWNLLERASASDV